MYEFIVLDKINNILFEDEVVLSSCGSVYTVKNGKVSGYFNADEVDVFCLVIRDDTPERNKIYADYSIIEFNLKQDENLFTLRGFFFYDKTSLQYAIRSPYNKRFDNVFRANQNNISNIKVIGNLLQHKHLLAE